MVAAASIPLLLRVVPPNRFYGLRTRRTLASRELWFRANRVAGCAFFLAAAASSLVFLAEPEYASGRSLTGLLVFVVPLGAALLVTLGYLRYVGGARATDS
jgi:uncharacterized membrane protein